MKLLPPVTYQGGKGRLAAQIVNAIGLPLSVRFYDLCCGSGAVAIAAVNAGQDPKQITMVDLSPWGLFWKAIGDGSFSLEVFKEKCAALPPDPQQIQKYMEELYLRPPDESCIYNFILLQAASLGGKAIWIKDGRWRNGSFRDYWLPTTTSNRRYPVNPMMPMPTTIVERMTVIVEKMRGVEGICADISCGTFLSSICGGVAYIDPPYAGTTAYGHDLDVVMVASSLNVPCWVSEGLALTDSAICLSKKRLKGGITGNRKKTPNEEWLSAFRPKN